MAKILFRAILSSIFTYSILGNVKNGKNVSSSWTLEQQNLVKLISYVISAIYLLICLISANDRVVDAL